MKKILAIFLALVTIMSVALVACDKNNGGTTGGNSNDDDDDDIFVTQGNGKDTSDTKDTGDDTKDTSDDWVAVSKTVYLAVKYDLRTAPNFNDRGTSALPMNKESKSGVEVLIGTELSVVAKKDRWYKVNYNGGEYYISCTCVVDSKSELDFTRLEGADQFDITLKKDKQVNIRTVQMTASNYEENVTLKGEVTLKVVGMDTTKKWYKVLYNGGEYYLYIAGVKDNFSGLPDDGPDGGDAL